jgi:hypothetical protein
LDVLGLAHVADTVVGDENLRGISGGQKRRVSVGEMMTDPNCSFFSFENITDGLASTDSLSLIQTLKRGCKSYNIAGIVSLLQASDEVVEQFDKLIVLTNNGEMAYFGPVDRQSLREIFQSDKEEDSGSICDLVLRQSVQDVSQFVLRENKLIDNFKKSALHQELAEELAQIRESAPPARERNLDDLLPDKKYSTSRFYQFKIICLRRLKLVARNAVTYTRVVIAMLFGTIIGSLFGELAVDLTGALGRTGYMFLNCFLVLMLSSAVVLPEAFRQRPTLFKHRSAEFFSGRVAYFAQVMVDIPLSIAEAILLSAISYYWVDMNPGAEHFFYFMGTLIGLEFVGQAFGRLLCALFRKQVSANAMSTVVIIGFGTVAGFMPSYSAIPWILRWLSWVTPVAYAFEGLLLNEFAGRNFSPVGLVDSNGDVRAGAVGGDSWLSMFDIPRAQWGTNDQIMAFNMGMLFIMAVIYDVIGLYFVEHTREWYHNQTRRPQSRVKSFGMGPFKEEQQSENLIEEDQLKVAPDPASKNEWPNSLAVRNLCYHVPFKTEKRFTFNSILGPCLVRLSGNKTEKEELPKCQELTLLHNVEARFGRGQMCALMGSSGRYPRFFNDDLVPVCLKTIVCHRCGQNNSVGCDCWV